MKENNVDYLINQVKYTGFGDSLEFAIRENVAKGEPEFDLKYKPDFGNDKVESTLHFKKSKKEDNYFFNSYDVTVAQKEGEALQQNFAVFKAKQILVRDGDGNIMNDKDGKELKEWINSSITLKEAYNLMEGRSVLKDYVVPKKEDDENGIDKKYSKWNTIDFSTKESNGNYAMKKYDTYELDTKLSTHHIKDFNENPSVKKEIMDSLQKGNRQVVTVVMPDGKEEKRGYEANPKFKTANKFDNNQRVKNQSEKKGETIAEDGTKKNENKKKGQGVS
ncbi:hypothetical protein SAMN05216464_110183 [Mucilaginibacter pineti]|uniref:Uncharacterized protein n=1 Tax=Mucilaginibacter pineti TaxID=1391627 RepID=A0A1G7GKA9_9SPHI|nr:hypothetical protein [Mucilaginibacter pineti]SDE88531.1 hypothetical protein SAMN05216464_110183 [Mucilaginibacter pineti]